MIALATFAWVAGLVVLWALPRDGMHPSASLSGDGAAEEPKPVGCALKTAVPAVDGDDETNAVSSSVSEPFSALRVPPSEDAVQSFSVREIAVETQIRFLIVFKYQQPGSVAVFCASRTARAIPRLQNQPSMAIMKTDPHIRFRTSILLAAMLSLSGIATSVRADRAENAFVVVEGEGVVRLDGRNFAVLASGKGESLVKVTAQPGWKLDTPSSAKVSAAKPLRYKATDASHEGSATGQISGLTATVTFSGLPANNSDFGRKTVTFSVADVTINQVFEVFYPAHAYNHPNDGGQHSFYGELPVLCQLLRRP